MNNQNFRPVEADAVVQAQDWVRLLAVYRTPDDRRSWFELTITLVPFIALWAVAWWAITIHPLLAVGIALLNGGFLVRLFCIQHDCGHSAFLHSKSAGSWVGRALGCLTLTPYDVWRRSHAIHHAHSGNLAHRGIGDVVTLTLREYQALPLWRKIQYRIYRNPIFLFGIVPFYLFFIQNRLPIGFTGLWQCWVSSMSTNIVILAILATIVWFGGWMPVLLVFIPVCLTGATIGVWLFYVQHQFEETHWEQDEDWQVHDAALFGSSHYVLPKWMQWMTANIGIHHVHHLYARIPFYRLPEVLRDHPQLATAQILTLKESFANARLHLWDEKKRRLLSFAEATRA